MRLLFTTFLALVSLALFSQSPEKINYQSIVRDLAGNVIQNQPISLRMSILSDSINGTIVYQETFQPTTNNFGLVNIKIGEGTPVIATMSSVDWSNGPFFLESAVDVTGGTNYIVVSTSQFMSVPYALYAKESPLDTTQVQNIVNQQTNNFLDSISIQNMIDSSVLNIDSTLIASWGYIDSNSIMILINNNSLDSTTIQNMIDNSIVNIDSSTVASWGYLDSSTIQILINNSTIDSSSVANWGYLDSTTIQNIITQQTNNYLDSTSIQNMIDNSVTNIDSSTVASWGYVDSSSIMILINNNSLDSAAIQNMINSSITNVDSSTVASWGYLDSSSIIALISNSNIDSSSVANWGYLDSVSIQNMINNSSVNVDSAMIANFGFVAGPHTIDTDTQIDSTGIANYGFVTSSQVLDSSTVQNMINNSSSNVDSSTVSNWGFVDSSTVINLINQSGYLDSLTIQSMIDSAIGSTTSINSAGIQLLYPDGLKNISPFYLTNDIIVSTTSNGDYWNGTNSQIDSVTYSPPVGKKLYIQTAVMRYFGSSPSWIWYPLLEINGEPIIRGGLGEIYFSNPIIIGSEDTICLRPAELSNGMNYPSAIRGFLIDENIDVAATTYSIKSTGTVSGAVYDQFIVPQNKIFILLNVFTENTPNASYTSLMNSKNQIIYNSNQNLDNWSSGDMRYLTSPMIFESGDTIRGHWQSTLNGYLVDEDYFSSSGSSSGSGSNSTIDSTTISNMGFVDSMTVVNMINSGGGSAVFGEFQDITDSVLNFGNVLMNDTLRAPSDGFYVVKAQENGTGTVSLKIDSLQDLSSNSINGSQIIYRSSWSQGTGLISTITCPIKKDWYWWTSIAGGNIQKIYWVPIINNSSSNSTIDSTTISNMGFVDSMTVVNMINNSSGLGSFSDYDTINFQWTNFNSNFPEFRRTQRFFAENDGLLILKNKNGNGQTGCQLYFYSDLDSNAVLGGATQNSRNIFLEWEFDNRSYFTIPIIKNQYWYLEGTTTGCEYNLMNEHIIVNFNNTSSNSGSGSGSNSSIDSTTVANWGFSTDTDTQLDSTGIANLGYVAGPHTIDTDTQIDSTGIANYGFVTSSQVLDSSTVQNMINNSSSNVDSSTVSNWGFVDSSTVINLINESGYLDSLTIQSMIDLVNTSGTSLGAFGDYQDINFTWSIAPPGGYFGGSTETTQEFYTSNDALLMVRNDGDGSGYASNIYLFYSDSAGIINQPFKAVFVSKLDFITIPIPKNKYWRLQITGNRPNNSYLINLISNSGSGSNSTVDSTTISNMGFVDSMTVVNMINSSGGGSGGMSFIDPVYLFYYSTTAYGGQPPNSEIVYNAGNPNNPTGYKVSIYNSITNINPITNNQSPNGVDSLIINFDSILGVHYDEIILYYNLGGQSGGGGDFTFTSTYESDNIKYPFLQNYHTASSSVFMTNQNSGNIIIKNSESGIVKIYYKIGGVSNPFLNLIVVGHFSSNTSSNSGSGSNSSIDSTTVANWGFSTDTDTQIDSTGIANLGYVAGPHTIDTDTQIDSAGVASFGYLDSVSIRNMIDSMVAQSVSSSGSGVGNLRFPDGFSGLVPVVDFSGNIGGSNTTSTSSYTVPPGKNLYITNLYKNINSNSVVEISGKTIFAVGTSGFDGNSELFNPLIVSSGEIISGFLDFWGFLVDVSPNVQPICVSADYQVPANKKLVILNACTYPSVGRLYINGLNYNSLLYGNFNNSNSDTKFVTQPIIINENTFIEKQFSSDFNINGYLVDSDFFSSSSSSSGSGSNSTIDSTTVANWGFSTDTDTQLDSTGIANLGYVAGPHTIDTDTQIDSAGIAALGYVAGPKTIDTDTDTQLDSAGIAALGYVAGPKTIDTDTQLDSVGISALGYVAGLHTIDTDTQIDSAGIAGYGYVAGPHTIDTDTQIDSAAIAAMGYLDSVSIRNMIDSLVAESVSSSGSGSGISLSFPDKIINISSISQKVISPTDYIVPTGKNLYVTNVFSYFQDSIFINTCPIYRGITGGNVEVSNGNGISDYGELIHNPLILGDGDILRFNKGFTGFLVDQEVSPQTISIANSIGGVPQYTVPNGKIFILLNVFTGSSLLKNGIEILSSEYSDISSSGNTKLRTLTMPIVFSSGDVISHEGIGLGFPTKATLNGYLVDEDYFSSSSNSSSGSNSNIDSTTVANWGFSTDTDTQIDSTGIANLGYVAGPQTVDTDTQIDSTGIAALGYVAGPHTTDTDTQIDSAGIANYGFIDSVTVMNMINQYSSNSSGGSGTVGGNSFIFPEGYSGTPITHFFGNGSYTVPTGKSLYVTIRYSASGDLKINNTTVLSGTNNYGGGSLGLLLPLILNSGDILTSTSSNSSFHGFLIDENLSSITHSFGSGNYTVPSDKTLYILNRYSNNGDLKINGTTVLAITNNAGGGSGGLLLPVIVSAGDVVSSTNSSTSFNGYLADTSYFESSSSNIDSAAIAAMGFVDSMTVVNMINSGGGASGKTFNFPEGFEGEGIMQNVFNNPYTVPSGKRLYMTYWYDGSPLVDNLSRNVPTHKPLIINSGQVVSTVSTSATPYFQGFLVDANIGLTAIMQNVFNNPYTVPSGKRLYMTYWYDGSPLVDNLSRNVPTDKPLIINSGQVVSTVSTSATPYFQGYIVDEDYFKTESGTSSGSSSSSGSGSNANTLIYTTSGF